MSLFVGALCRCYTDAMQLYQIDDDGRLFMSADLRDWSYAAPYGIDVVIDLEGGLDLCIPTN